MNKRYIIFLLAAAFMFQTCKNAEWHMKKAEEHHEQQEYSHAIEHYQEAIAKDHKDQGTIYYKMAESYRKSNRPQEAKEFYSKALGKVNDDEVLFWYAYTLKADGQYPNAAQQFQKYVDQGTNFDLINRAKNEIENIKVLEEIAAMETDYRVKNMGHMNTTEVEYAPFKLKDKVYFTSSRGANIQFPGTGTGFTDVWEFIPDSPEDTTGQLQQLPKVINKENAHEATPVFSKDGKTMYFSRGNTGEKKGSTDVDIYMSKMGTDGQWTEPVLLPFNDEHAWDSSPALSADGKKLYFASDREGGNGGVDIYYATIDNTGNWGNVKNLGTPINSRGNDMFPFEDPHGNLYFSSDGHPSLGSLDIFKVVKEGEEVKVKNLGKPVNSNFDDFSIFLTDSLNGFFCSNRPGGKGDDDIYVFDRECLLFYVIDGITYGKDSKNKEFELEGVKVQVIDNDTKDTATVFSDAKGKFKYMAAAGKKYTLIGTKHPEYMASDTVSVKVEGSDCSKHKNRDTIRVATNLKLVLPKIEVGVVVRIDNIFYEFNKWTLTAESKTNLNKVVQLLKDHPEMNIELRSHTDFRGSASYNRTLSQKRAESAVTYLIEQGIEKSRLKAQGYGEDVPATTKDQNGNEVTLTERYITAMPTKEAQEEAHQINRRTEFKVTGIDENKKIKIEVSQENLTH